MTAEHARSGTGVSGFRFRHAAEVRFRDLDPMGHAHHSLPLIYFEDARAAYWRRVAGRADVADIDYIMAEIQVRFHGRIRFPGTLDIGVRTTEIGDKSFTMAYEARASDGTLLATGRSVQVMFDYDADRSIPVPHDVRRRIEAFESDAGPDGPAS